ncbi:MAG: hypothetical protein R3D52_03005 [Xanthobacteraceae bacterium]
MLAGDDAWRERVDILFDGLIPMAGANLFGHLSLLNALDLRLRAAEIVIVREEVHNDPSLLQRSISHSTNASFFALLLRKRFPITPCPREDRRGCRQGRLRLRRGALLVAGRRPRAAGQDHPGDARLVPAFTEG